MYGSDLIQAIDGLDLYEAWINSEPCIFAIDGRMPHTTWSRTHCARRELLFVANWVRWREAVSAKKGWKVIE